MAKLPVKKTNFTAGELSPRIEGRPDLAKYFNGASTLENYLVFPQGGAYRAPGSRFVKEVKTSAKKTRLIPFIVNRTTAYVLEFGDGYIRFYKNGARIESPPGTPVEVVSPFLEADLPAIQYVQSVDVLFLDHPSYQTRKLSRVSDTSWSLTMLALRPPPSFEDLTDVSAGATLARAADTGTGVNFTASAAVFLDGDVGRNIISGAARAVITALGGASPNAVAVCDILDSFAGLGAPIASGAWFLNLSPQSAIDTVSKSKPVGTKVTINFKNNVGGAAQDTLRTGAPSPEIGKFIKVLGGEIEITAVATRTQCSGIIRTSLSKADKTKNPTGVEAGDWTLNVTSWAAAKGFPSALTFFQGRLYHGGSAVAQPTTFWGSASDDYENYGVGGLADDAVEYTIASRQLNKIQWLLDLRRLLIGTLGSIFTAKGPGVDTVLGGDVTPYIEASNAPGAAPIQPVILGTRAVYVDASQTQALDLGYDFNEDNIVGTDLTLLSEHISGSGFALEQISYARNPNSIMYFVRKDGQMACLTYYRIPELVVAWSRRKTDGAYESCCVIPHPDGDRDQVWTIVNRTINGATKRYVEFFEDKAAEFSTRNWKELHTDCAFIYSGAAVTNVAGLGHLEGKTVDVIADGAYKGTRVITGGTFTVALTEAAAKIEIGLHYDSTLTTMRPAIQDAIIEGKPKIWNELWIRLLNSIGGSVKTPSGTEQQIVANVGGQVMDSGPPLFTGDKQVPLNGIDDTGKVTIFQKQPYPQTILMLFGSLNAGDR